MERPVVPFVLELLGGLFTVGGTLFGLFAYNGYPYGVGALYAILALTASTFALVVIFSAAMTYVAPSQHVAWGVVVLVCSVGGFFFGIGGLYGAIVIFTVVGMILGIVGGSLAIAWKPSGVASLMSIRVCLACGRHVPVEYPLCPFCGTPTPLRNAATGAVVSRPPVPPYP